MRFQVAATAVALFWFSSLGSGQAGLDQIGVSPLAGHEAGGTAVRALAAEGSNEEVGRLSARLKQLGRGIDRLFEAALRRPADPPYGRYLAERARRFQSDLRRMASEAGRLPPDQAPELVREIRRARRRALDLERAAGLVLEGRELPLRRRWEREQHRRLTSYRGDPPAQHGLNGGLSGRVTAAGTGSPLVGVDVEVYDQDGFWAGFGSTTLTGDYSVGSLVPGTYFAVTGNGNDYLDEIYDNFPCTVGSCDPTSGTPIAVVAGATTPGIDFALQQGGVVAGRVREAASGVAIPDCSVELWTAGGDPSGLADTDAAGRYSIPGLATGSYVAVTSSCSEFRQEIYDDIPCPGAFGGCDPNSGTPISVTVGATTEGIDFALDRLGSIAGTVTDAVTGDPLPAVPVTVWGPTGSQLSTGHTDPSGHYQTGGLLPGTYFVTTQVVEGYLDELFDDLPCPIVFPSTCDPTAGTPVAVALNATTPGIDFALDRLGGIAGTVTEEGSGQPLEGTAVEVWSDVGTFRGSASSDAAGQYAVEGLPPGGHFVTTQDGSGHLDELYDDLPCLLGAPQGCDPTTGTSVAVTVNETTAGIDFALVLGGSIAGTVTESVSGQPVLPVLANVWDATGTHVTFTFTSPQGQYVVQGLPAGTYFVTTTGLFSNYLNELYDNFPCLDGGFGPCDPTTGTPVPVSLGMVTGGIDFALDSPGHIGGTVTDAATGEPLASVPLLIWDASGTVVAGDMTNQAGSYTSSLLLPGTYFVTTEVGFGHLDELFDDLPCHGGGFVGCNPTSGTPVPVAANVTTGGIDFALVFGPGLQGQVTRAEDSSPMPGVAIDLWSAAGQYTGSTGTDAAGRFRLALNPGSYYVSTDNGLGATDEIFDDVACPLGPAFGGFCDPTTGTLVVVAPDQPALSGIDFELATPLIFADGFESGDFTAWSQVVP